MESSQLRDLRDKLTRLDQIISSNFATWDSIDELYTNFIIHQLEFLETLFVRSSTKNDATDKLMLDESQRFKFLDESVKSYIAKFNQKNLEFVRDNNLQTSRFNN